MEPRGSVFTTLHPAAGARFSQLLASLIFAMCCLCAACGASSQELIWKSIGPEVGNIACLAVECSDSGTVYARPELGGIFESTEWPARWTGGEAPLNYV